MNYFINFVAVYRLKVVKLKYESLIYVSMNGTSISECLILPPSNGFHDSEYLCLARFPHVKSGFSIVFNLIQRTFKKEFLFKILCK